ncbi:MAG TPA: RNA methyltransferase substrate-binding domain-containing protein, partial [Thermoanaerobaculia bacterium]|nr:RNA methyltransferase substrate-binding domain-containing protein [Thermoanaerobaculia bacterium]
MILSRLHPIEEAVRSRAAEIEWVLLDSARRDRRIGELARLCRERHVPLRFGTRETLDRVARNHQGALARMAARGYASEEAREPRFRQRRRLQAVLLPQMGHH